jgi:hypothetical protein
LGYRASVALGTGLIFAGTAALLTLGPSSRPWHAVPPMAVLGLGMGFSVTGFIIAVQNAVGWGQRGLATATAQFFRQIGGAVGVALFGAVLNSQLLHTLSTLGLGGAIAGGETQSLVNALVSPEARAGMTPAAYSRLQVGLAGGLHDVFGIATVLAGLAFVVAWLFPSGAAAARIAGQAARSVQTVEAVEAGAGGRRGESVKGPPE